MSLYPEMHDTVSWEVMTGEGEIPGLPTFAAAVNILGRKDERITTISEDKVSNVIFTLQPQHQPHAGDRLDGAEVLEVEVVKDVQSKVHRWVAYARA